MRVCVNRGNWEASDRNVSRIYQVNVTELRILNPRWRKLANPERERGVV